MEERPNNQEPLHHNGGLDMSLIANILYLIFLSILLYLIVRPIQFLVMVLEGVFNFILGKK